MRTNLPRQIRLPDGTVLDKRLQCVPGERYSSRQVLTGYLRCLGGRYRYIEVLEKNLRGKLDLYGRPYQPTTWLMTNVTTPHNHVTEPISK